MFMLTCQLSFVYSIEIDAKEGDERTALHVAAMAGQPGSVQLLLLHNALDSCIDASG